MTADIYRVATDLRLPAAMRRQDDGRVLIRRAADPAGEFRDIVDADRIYVDLDDLEAQDWEIWRVRRGTTLANAPRGVELSRLSEAEGLATRVEIGSSGEIALVSGTLLLEDLAADDWAPAREPA